MSEQNPATTGASPAQGLSSLPAPPPADTSMTGASSIANPTTTSGSTIGAESSQTQTQAPERASSTLENGVLNTAPVMNSNAEAGPSSPTKVLSPAKAAQRESTDIEMTNGEGEAVAGPQAEDQQRSGSSAVPIPEVQAEQRGDVQMATDGTGTEAQVQGGQPHGEPGNEEPGTAQDIEQEEPDISHLFAARREEELARRDRSLADFLLMLDGYKPLIPEEITEYYLQRAGFECSDPRLKRLLSLSAQKFVSDLSRDAYHFAKLRTNGAASSRGRPAAGVDRNRIVLTMDDLSLALGDHGVNVKKPDYYM